MKTSSQAILVAFALVAASCAGAEAATIRVANNGVDSPTCGQAAKPCRSISKGLAAAANGDTIEVGPGLYGDIDADGQFVTPGDEQAETGTGCECVIHVTKTVTLISRSGATQTLIHPGPDTGNGEYTGAGYLSLVQIDAPGVVFGQRDHGFTVASKAVPAGGDGLNGIMVGDAGTGAEIRGNFIAMNERGIFTSAPEIIVSDNLIQTNTVGVMMERGHDSVVSGNGIQGNDVGLGLLGIGITISGNMITGNRHLGIILPGGGGHAVSGNGILGNGVGVRVSPMADAVLHGNNIFGNDTQGPSPNAGLVSESSAAVDASGNYWGWPATSGFAGDEVYNLGTGSLVSLPAAAGPFKIAIQAMK